MGSIIGVLGLITGVAGLVLYLQSKVGARPACQLSSIRLIGRNEQQLPDEVRILYDDNDVPRLTLTEIYFWNFGTETIRGNQVVEDDPIRLSFNLGDKILAAHVVAVTRPVNKCMIEVPPNAQHVALLTFDFLDPNDGMRLEVLHTSEKRYPNVSGTIRSIPKGIKVLTPSKSLLFVRAAVLAMRIKEANYIALCLGVIVSIGALLPRSWLLDPLEMINRCDEPEKSVLLLRLCMLGLGALYIFISLTHILPNRRKYPKLLDMKYSNETKSEAPRIDPEVKSALLRDDCPETKPGEVGSPGSNN